MVISSLTACDYNNEDKAIRQMCVEIHEQYPMATLQDVYKTCYQDYFGAEHLMSDTAAARNYLTLELEECRDTDMSLMPKHEATGFRHRFTRINLACIVDGELTEEQLLTMFIDAAGKDNAFGNSWADELLQAELQLASEGKHAVRHSETFRNTYNPHYRIVKGNLYEKLNNRNKYQHGPAVPDEEAGNWSEDDEMFVFRKVITE